MGLQICKEDGPCCSQGTDADTEAKIHHVPPSFAFQEDNGSFYGDLDSDRSPANLDEARFLFHLLCASWRFSAYSYLLFAQFGSFENIPPSHQNMLHLFLH